MAMIFLLVSPATLPVGAVAVLIAKLVNISPVEYAKMEAVLDNMHVMLQTS